MHTSPAAFFTTAFISGCSATAHKDFSLGNNARDDWRWEIGTVDECVCDFLNPHTTQSMHSVLQDVYLQKLEKGLNAIVSSLGRSDSRGFTNTTRGELDLLSQHHQQVADLIRRIAIAAADPDQFHILLDTVGTLPARHLPTIRLAKQLLPDITIPAVEVLLDAYNSGLLPYGIMNQRVDQNHVGPVAVRCLNPAAL